METRLIHPGVKLYFPSDERETADIVEAVCGRCVSLMRDTWGLAPPKLCRIYIMTPGWRFLLHGAPWYACIPLVVLFPILYHRYQKIWRWAEGVTHRHRYGSAICLKPSRLLAPTNLTGDDSLKEPNSHRRTELTTCHELVHAYSAHLKLPFWLNEGIAMVTVDRYFGRATVQGVTLQTLNHPRYRKSVGMYDSLPEMSKEFRDYHYVRGYWITRYLMDTNSRLLKELLQKRHDHLSIKRKIAAASGLSFDAFWDTVEERVIAHYGQRSTNATFPTSKFWMN